MSQSSTASAHARTAEVCSGLSTSEVDLRPFRLGDAQAFHDLNEEWISLYFGMEELDHHLLLRPEENILLPGGYIVMAAASLEIVGCCALLPGHSPGIFEVGKMAVAPRFRGHGIGRRLLAAVIAHARSIGATLLTLESSTRLPNAVHLYESLGFRHIPSEERVPSPYARANVFMDLRL